MIERKIIIGLITSTEYCTKIAEIWDETLLSSPTARRIAQWVWKYFSQYKQAPKQEIETIFLSHLKSGRLSKDIASEIEDDILPALSLEYENEGFNVDFTFDETAKYFAERRIELLVDRINTLKSEGKIDDALSVIHDFKLTDSVTSNLNMYICSVKEIRKKAREPLRVLMHPWLVEGQTSIIYGNYGTGKSLLTILIAYMLGLREEYYIADECSIGEWFVKNPTGCLYMDGELGEVEMEERIRQFEWLGRQQTRYQMKIFSIPEYQVKTEDSFFLAERKNQLKLLKWLQENPTYKLIVLDSASTLFGLQEENDNSEWNNKINPLLRDFRALGVACILLHHSGKDNKKGLRGASSMGAIAHNIYRITNYEDKSTDNGEAWFTLHKDKQRKAGKLFRTFSIHFYQNEEQTETHWTINN